MRYFHGESYARTQRLLSENKVRTKDEIPNEIMFISQKNYHSFERIFGEKDNSFNYDYFEMSEMLKTPIVRNDEN